MLSVFVYSFSLVILLDHRSGYCRSVVGSCSMKDIFLPAWYLLSLLSSTQNHTKRKTKCLNSDIRIINPNKFSKGWRKSWNVDSWEKSCLKQRPLTRSELTAQEVRIPGDTIYREAPALLHSPVFSIYTYQSTWANTTSFPGPWLHCLFLAIACIIIRCTHYLSSRWLRAYS